MPDTDLAALGADVEWPDAEAAALARSADRATERAAGGRLADLLEWLAGTQGTFPPRVPARARCIVLGSPGSAVTELAASLDVGVRAVPAGEASGLAAGAAIATDEIDSGTDLLVLADTGPDDETAAALVVSLLTGAEPVALLPRGEDAVDTAAWVAGAVRLRDRRHAVAQGGVDPDELLASIGDAHLATSAGLVLQAIARRTPVVLDGTGAVVAGLLASRAQSRATRWWRAADTSADPIHTRAMVDVATRPLLDLATTTGDGIAGVLTVPLLRAAALAGKDAHE